MAGTTVRLSEETRAIVKELAGKTNESMQDVLAKAVESYRREQFWRETNQAYAEMRANPEEWKEYQDELRLWENTLMDGLEDEPYDLSDQT
ncbi:MAG: hypothetical protein HW416_1788 [Chloroflexi bacterium]|nr:hypothetical protein [Chloroflexota bacterium]